MNMREEIVAVADAYCAATGRSRARLSTLLLNSGSRLDAIADGRDLNTATFEAAMQWLSDNWPADTAWPDGVGRPGAPHRAASGAVGEVHP